MPNIKNRPFFLNKDDDIRNLEPTDMTNALNVKTVNSDGSNAGALETIKGNEKVTNTNLPAGTNQCIGVVIQENTNNIFWFNWNSNGNHGIYYYNDITGLVTQVLQSSELKFSKRRYVQGVAYQGRSKTEVLLYFTDHVNPPRKINVRKAKNGEYPTIDQEVLSLVKYQPSAEPTWNYTKDTSVVYNNVYNKNFQFAYRYIYDDGERSAYSYRSDLSYSNQQLYSSINVTSNNVDPYNGFNNIEVTVATGSSIVKKIEVVAREGNLGEWKTIKTLENNTNNQTLTFDFKNDGNYPVADPIEINKLFDNVPLQAEAIAILNNRLFLANYKEGYPLNPDIDAIDNNTGQITIKPRFEQATFPSLDGAKTSFNVNVDYSTHFIDYSGLAAIEAGDLYIFNFSAQAKQYRTSAKTTSDTYISTIPNIIETEVAQPGDTVNDVLERISLRVDGLEYPAYQGKISIKASLATGQRIYLKIEWRSNPTAWQSGDIISVSVNGGSFISVSSFTSDDKYNGKYGKLEAGSTFKGGGKYSLAIVEYDESGRSSVAQTFDNNDVYVPFITERYAFTDYSKIKGICKLDWRINENIKPSSWAKKWSWAITENTSVGDFIQYSATSAYASQNATIADSNKIYLPFRGFIGQDSSYVDSFGAEIEYNFQKGDRLRVISYYDDFLGQRVLASGKLDFRVVSYENYTEDNSPIYDPSSSSAEETTGFILGIEPTSTAGWTLSDVKAGTSLWQESGGSVIFEIYRPKKQIPGGDDEDSEDRQVYYEVGGLKSISNPGTASRKFQGDIRDAGDSLSYSVLSQNVNRNQVTIVDDTSLFVIGDTVNTLDGASNVIATATILDIEVAGANVTLFLDSGVDDTTISTIQLADKAAAGQITQGDVWFRPRLIRNDNSVTSVSYIAFPVESYFVSDFYQSKSWSKGRGNAFIGDADRVDRFSTITYSQPYFNDTNVNGFSSFNAGLANFRQYSQNYGPIHRMVSEDSYLAIFQENKLGRVPISRRLIETADGGTSLVLSNEILNEIDYSKWDFGLTKAESFADFDGDYFGWDIKKGKVWEYNSNGFQLISEYKMSSYFEDKSDELLKYFQTQRVVMGIDRDFGEVLLSCVDNSTSQAAISGVGSFPVEFAGASDDGSNIRVPAIDINVVEGSTQEITFGTEERTFGSITETFGEWGSSFQDADILPETTYFQYTGDIITSGTKTTTVKTNISGADYYLEGDYDFETNEIVIPKAQTDAGLTLTLGDGETFNGFTLSYDKTYNRWISYYSFKPEMYATINKSLFSFKDGELYRHYSNSVYNNFYGVQYNGFFEVNFNLEPSKVKRFLAASMESSSGNWTAALTTDLVSTSIPSTFWNEKEGIYQTYVPRSSSSSNSTSLIGLGNIDSISGNQVTINGLNAGSLGIFVGDSVYENGTLIGTITSIDSGSQITLSSVSGLVVTDFIYVQKQEVIDGDELRGAYCTAKYTTTQTDFQEVYAVNMDVKISKLHNT